MVGLLDIAVGWLSGFDFLTIPRLSCLTQACESTPTSKASLTLARSACLAVMRGLACGPAVSAAGRARVAWARWCGAGMGEPGSDQLARGVLRRHVPRRACRLHPRPPRRLPALLPPSPAAPHQEDHWPAAQAGRGSLLVPAELLVTPSPPGLVLECFALSLCVIGCLRRTCLALSSGPRAH
eukprot:181303-Rhodomonas_salina.2